MMIIIILLIIIIVITIIVITIIIINVIIIVIILLIITRDGSTLPILLRPNKLGGNGVRFEHHKELVRVTNTWVFNCQADHYYQCHHRLKRECLTIARGKEVKAKLQPDDLITIVTISPSTSP